VAYCGTWVREFYSSLWIDPAHKFIHFDTYAIVRRTLLLRLGYHEGLTCMQLWVVHHLVSQTLFDIWDLMLCEMEDMLAEGFKGHR
jgi:hypothetical protein